MTKIELTREWSAEQNSGAFYHIIKADSTAVEISFALGRQVDLVIAAEDVITLPPTTTYVMRSAQKTASVEVSTVAATDSEIAEAVTTLTQPYPNRAAAAAAWATKPTLVKEISWVASVGPVAVPLILGAVEEIGNNEMPGFPNARPSYMRFAEHYGSIGDGNEANAAANTAAWEAALAAVAATNVGGTIDFVGRHVINNIVIETDGVYIRGHGGQNNKGGSDLRCGATIGPAIRWKGAFGRIENFYISTTAARRAALRITKDNYVAQGLTRDDQNPQIWIEGDDTVGAGVPSSFTANNVWAHNGPSDGWVFGPGTYGSRVEMCGANDCLGHGRVVTGGFYTGRTNRVPSGVISFHEWSSRNCRGHGCLTGHPDADPLETLRVNDYAVDNYNCATTPALLVLPFESIHIADDCFIEGAYDGESVNGAVAIGGRSVKAHLRLLSIGTAQSAVRVINPHATGGRVTTDVEIVIGNVSGSANSNPCVAVDVGATGVRVKNIGPTTTFPTLAPDAQESQRANVRSWDGTLQIPLQLWGKSANDDTTLGGVLRTDGGGANLSLVRNNLPLLLNRTASNGQITTRRRDGTEISSDLVQTTTAATTATTILTLNTRAAGLVIVSGAFDDAGTVRRFYDVLLFSFGIAPTLIAAREENAPSARTYGVVSNSQLTLSMASNTYQVRASASTTTAAL